MINTRFLRVAGWAEASSFRVGYTYQMPDAVLGRLALSLHGAPIDFVSDLQILGNHSLGTSNDAFLLIEPDGTPLPIEGDSSDVTAYYRFNVDHYWYNRYLTLDFGEIKQIDTLWLKRPFNIPYFDKNNDLYRISVQISYDFNKWFEIANLDRLTKLDCKPYQVYQIELFQNGPAIIGEGPVGWSLHAYDTLTYEHIASQTIDESKVYQIDLKGNTRHSFIHFTPPYPQPYGVGEIIGPIKPTNKNFGLPNAVD